MTSVRLPELTGEWICCSDWGNTGNENALAYCFSPRQTKGANNEKRLHCAAKPILRRPGAEAKVKAYVILGRGTVFSHLPRPHRRNPCASKLGYLTSVAIFVPTIGNIKSKNRFTGP